MMALTLEENETVTVVHLAGAIDISSAAELKAMLLQALKPGKDVQISLQSTTYLDVTAIELLWAVGREANGSGFRFGVTGQVPDGIASLLSEAGIELPQAWPEVNQSTGV
jgi:anti-anti-sigma factor